MAKSFLKTFFIKTSFTRTFFTKIARIMMALTVLGFAGSLFSQEVKQTKEEYRSANENLSEEEFRRGVQSFYRGSFNEAILQFEKALAYAPEDNRTLDWMAKSYYQSGLEATAIQTWERVVQAGYGGLLLPNKLSIIKERRVNLGEDERTFRYTDAGSFYGVFNGNFIFAGPTSSLPNSDGTSFVTAYASNELLKIDVNGYVVDRIRGPLNGFDHPLDIIRLKSGDILISETAGDRLALLTPKGKFIKYIGGKGIGLGQMVGPCYLAQDSHENIYVTDYGNARVDVFNKDGTPLFSFGKEESKNEDLFLSEDETEASKFLGLKGPTGIAIIDDAVFVACDVSGCIYQFDTAGNFVRRLVQPKTFSKLESLKVNGKNLYVAARNKVYCVDIETGAVFENVNVGNGKSRLTSATKDVNGNVLVTDYKANEVYVMARTQDIAGGLFVQIGKVDSRAFPKVTFNVKVENRTRSPIVGLKDKNFYITEGSYPVSDVKLLGAGSEVESCNVTVIIDKSVASQSLIDNGGVDSAVRSIASAMAQMSEKSYQKGVMTIISAAAVPIKEYSGSFENCKIFEARALKAAASKTVAWDAAFRLAANDLVAANPKSAIVVITAGNSGERAFEKYSINQTATYLNNNSITTYFIAESDKVSEDFSYITTTTGGKVYPLWQSEGLATVARDIAAQLSGEYVFEYTSGEAITLDTKFLPLEVEISLLNRSGRDETGYFTPLE